MIGDFLAKLVTAPIEVVVMRIRILCDIVEDGGDDFEKQVKDIVE